MFIGQLGGLHTDFNFNIHGVKEINIYPLGRWDKSIIREKQ
jgi:hypothetical protein